jgi:phosphoglycerol transferase
MLARRPTWLPELLWVLGTALVATLVTVIDLQLWDATMHIPLTGAINDASFFAASVKDVVEHGWFTHNPDLAAPLGQSNLDFAASFGDTAHYALIRVIAVFLNDPIVVFNAFYLLGFPLIAVTSYLVLRDLGAARMPSLVMAVLFAFLPYHLLRHQNHLFLAAYYAVPLGFWLVMTLAEGRRLIDRGDRRRTAITLLVCVVVASASNYYAVFTMIALLLVVPLVALAQRSRQMVFQGLLVLAAIGLVFGLCHAPPVLYAAEHGRNTAIAERSPQESEDFGLKLTQMVLPRPDHRIARLARRGAAYEVRTPLVAEGFSPSLGVVATLGLIGAVVVLLTTGLGNRALSLRRRRVSIAGAVALVCFLVGTTSGISALIAFEITPQVRGWNRISLLIAFASLLVVALALTALGERWRARGRPAWLIGLLVAAVGVIGVLDQTSAHDAPGYPQIAAGWRSDQAFVRGMEDRLPAGTRVLQLPYVPYPENGVVNAMLDYDLFKGYLHSRRLRWSYGATKGRPVDWQDDAQTLAPQELALVATTAGFGALYVDRGGYVDNAAAIDTGLTQLTGGGPAGRSSENRLEWYDLRPVAARLAAKTTPSERHALRDALIEPVELAYGNGFSFQESAAGAPFRWGAADARIDFENPLAHPRRVQFSAGFAGGGPQTSTVTMSLPDGRSRTVTTDDKGTSVGFTFVVKPGGSTLRLHTDGPAAPNAPNNIRDQRLRVIDPKLRDQQLSAALLARLTADANGPKG